MVTKSAKVGIGFLILLATISFPGGFILRHSGTVFAQSSLDEFVDYVGKKEADRRQGRDLEHSVMRWIKEFKPLQTSRDEVARDGGKHEEVHISETGEFFAIVSYKNIGGLTKNSRIETMLTLYDKNEQKVSEFPILPWVGFFYISRNGEVLVIIGQDILQSIMDETSYGSIAFYNIPERKLIKKIDRSSIFVLSPGNACFSSNGKYFAGTSFDTGESYSIVVCDAQDGNKLWETKKMYGRPIQTAISDEGKVVALHRYVINEQENIYNNQIYFFSETGQLVRCNDLKRSLKNGLFLSNNYVSTLNYDAANHYDYISFFDLKTGQLLLEKPDRDVVQKWMK